MSLQAATTKGEGHWQYCNYGYDKTKYNSMADCMKDIDPSTKDELTDYGKRQKNKSTYHNSDNRSFWDKNSDTLRPIIIIGVAYYIWKSGVLNKILK